MDNYFSERLKTINLSIESMDPLSFETLLCQCHQTILNGGKLIFSGLGKNVPICEKIVGTLNSLGIPANFLHTNTAMHGDLGIIKDGDLVVVLSKSGNTYESILLIKYLLAFKKTTLWGFTFNRQSEMFKLLPSDCLALSLEDEGDIWDIVPNNSSSVYLIVLQGLALQLADKLGVKLSEFKINHPGGAIGEKLRG